MKTKDTFQKSKNDILSWYITCFSFTEYNNPKNIVKSYFGFNEEREIRDKLSLELLDSATKKAKSIHKSKVKLNKIKIKLS
jgi:hypothetical protein